MEITKVFAISESVATVRSTPTMTTIRMSSTTRALVSQRVTPVALFFFLAGKLYDAVLADDVHLDFARIFHHEFPLFQAIFSTKLGHPMSKFGDFKFEEEAGAV